MKAWCLKEVTPNISTNSSMSLIYFFLLKDTADYKGWTNKPEHRILITPKSVTTMWHRNILSCVISFAFETVRRLIHK